MGSARTECGVDVSGLTAGRAGRAGLSPAVCGRTRGSHGGSPSSESRWPTSWAELEGAERPGVPQGVEEAGDGPPWGCWLPGWRRKVSCPVFPSWRGPDWALHSQDRPGLSWTSGNSGEAPRARPRLAGQPWGNCNLYPLISSGTEMIQISGSTPGFSV